MLELHGLTMGLVGLGRIGQATAKLSVGFGMKVLAYDLQPPHAVPEGCQMAGLDTVFGSADIVSLHCPLTAENKHLVNSERLSQMKPTSFLINTSRGPLVDEQALADALNEGRIAGAGLDVLEVEPPQPDNPLVRAKNCVITPHIAWATRAARARLLDIAIHNVAAFIKGEPQNLVDSA